MAVIFQIILLFFTSSVTFAVAYSDSSQVLSYSAWKQEKIAKAKVQVSASKTKVARLEKNRIKKNQTKKSIQRTQDPQLNMAHQQLNQNEFNLEIAQDLSVTDYVVLYLSGQMQTSQLKAAATKMSVEETAQILEAYLRAVQAQQFDQNALKLPRHSNENDE